MKRIAVLTSGGDAPGMNAAVRAVIRTGIDLGYEMFGVHNGYAGLIAGKLVRMSSRDVGGIIDRGGTCLGTSRCEELKSAPGRDAAVETLQTLDIHGLIVIGGNGSQAGSHLLSNAGIRVIGVASTIDNDLFGADVSIGSTTAVEIAVECIDRLRTTASSHGRAFVVEVMGRNCGYLALASGIAGGAEAIVLPEVETDPEGVANEIRASYERGKSHAIVVVAEGARYNGEKIAHYFQEHSQRLGFELRLTKLGHIQRGGSPCAFDRILGSRLGAAAIEQLHGGIHGILLGYKQGGIVPTALSTVASSTKTIELGLLKLAQVLAL
jgi:6-phosphofructokinase 1